MTSKEYNRNYYLKNKDAIHAAYIEWYKNNKEKSNAYSRKYSQTPKGQLSRKQRNKRRMAARMNLLNYYKTRPCADCYQWFNTWQMDFDHRPGTDKKFCVAAKRLNGLQGVIAEINKCDVVCANCHRDRTYKRAHAVHLS